MCGDGDAITTGTNADPGMPMTAGQSRDVYSRGIHPTLLIYCRVQHTMHPYDENVIDVHIVHLSHTVTPIDRDAFLYHDVVFFEGKSVDFTNVSDGYFTNILLKPI